ncbi:unnamed protein product [Trichogramma brassicae]|uniref:Laminin EGF-like domain-containing protein n=1 Tax=Trichogramma brassicae TaxID=86971 RepID=A0A6H5I4U1_9HYME|nr:unnamed protein product [Trichogramma brassicae]
MNFDTLVNSASERVTRRLQGFIEYFRRFWLQSVGPINFSVFGIHTRTNNAIESYHSELLHRLGEHPPLWRWIGKIIKIQEKQWSDVDTMERGRSVRRQPKNTTMFRNFELQRAWRLFYLGEISSAQLLVIGSNLIGASFTPRLATLRPGDIQQVLDLENAFNDALPRNQGIDPEFDFAIVRQFRPNERQRLFPRLLNQADNIDNAARDAQVPLAANPAPDRGNGRRRRRQRRRARVGPMFGQRLFAAVDHIAVHQNDVMEAQEVPYVAPLAVDIVANVQRPPIEVEVPAAAVVANPIHDNDQLDIIGNNDQMVGDVVVNVQRPPIEVEVPTAAVVANPIHDNDQLDIIETMIKWSDNNYLLLLMPLWNDFRSSKNNQDLLQLLILLAMTDRWALPADLSLHGGNNDETYAHMQITNLRVNLSEFPAELESDKKPDGAYYAIGLHSSHCLGSEMDLDMVGSTCICEHNTVGKYCEQCKSQYRDAPWRRAQGSKTNACQACRCNGYSRQCRFDARLYEKTGCGGVCEN